MTITVLTALALVALATLLVARVAFAPRARAADRIAQIDSYTLGGGAAVAVPGVPAARRGPVETLGALVAARQDRERLAAYRRELLAAGMFGTSAETYLGYRILSLVGFPLFALWTALSSALPAALTAVFVALAFVCGWMLPKAIVARRARLRLEQIDRGMPELVDLLVVGVESGMGFAGAMRAASTRVSGPLGEELKLMLREQSLGASASTALQHMLERGDTPATRSFVRTIVQGERLGVSIGQMMRSLAEEMRKRRKAHAEELAHKAPVKILFPLVFLIFPAIFIVLLAPAAIKISQQLGG